MLFFFFDDKFNYEIEKRNSACESMKLNNELCFVFFFFFFCFSRARAPTREIGPDEGLPKFREPEVTISVQYYMIEFSLEYVLRNSSLPWISRRESFDASFNNLSGFHISFSTMYSAYTLARFVNRKECPSCAS